MWRIFQSTGRLGLIFDGAVALSLAATLAGVYAWDRPVPPTIVAPPPEDDAEPPPPSIADLIPPAAPIDATHRVRLNWTSDGRFGLVTTTGNPDDPTDDDKKLTYDASGGTNNTRVMIESEAPIFGGPTGRMISPIAADASGKVRCTWQSSGIQVEQLLELVAGEVSRRNDAIQVTYTMRNASNSARRVGIRVMIDTLIGGNDGVPFIAAGRDGVVTQPQTFLGNDVPDFIRALETFDLARPGVIVDIGLKSAEGERPSQVVLSHWPGTDAEWEYERNSPMGADSAVGIYYAPRPLGAGESRMVSFTYGLGTISSTRSGNAGMSLTAGGPFRAGGKFWLVALVRNPKEHRLRLELPEGFSSEPPAGSARDVPTGRGEVAQVGWLITIPRDRSGRAEFKARLEPGGLEERQSIEIQPRAGLLMLTAKVPFVAGRSNWVSAVVRAPKAGQTVELMLSPGLTLKPGDASRKSVPAGAAFGQVNWLVRADPGASGLLEASALLEPGATREKVSIQVNPARSILH